MNVYLLWTTFGELAIIGSQNHQGSSRCIRRSLARHLTMNWSGESSFSTSAGAIVRPIDGQTSTSDTPLLPLESLPQRLRTKMRPLMRASACSMSSELALRAAHAFLQNNSSEGILRQKELVNFYIRKIAGFGVLLRISRISCALQCRFGGSFELQF